MFESKSYDYFHGYITVSNFLDEEAAIKAEKYLDHLLKNNPYMHIIKRLEFDQVHKAEVSYFIKGRVEWGLTEHLDDVFLYGVKNKEALKEFLFKNDQMIGLYLDEFEPERRLLHYITGTLASHRTDDLGYQLYIENYYYDDYDLTAKNIADLQFEKGYYLHTTDFYKLMMDLATSQKVITLWKNKYHRGRFELLKGLKLLASGRHHQGVILYHELRDVNYLLAKINRKLQKDAN